jgi:protein-S-isoprenylcysteine O-methyltransferase Ste14
MKWKGLLKDRAAAMPLVIFAILASAGLLRSIVLEASRFSRAPSAAGAIEILCAFALIAFFVQQAALCLVRVLPLATAAGLLPRIVALASAYCGFLLVFVGREQLGPVRGLLSLSLSLLGTVGGITALVWLGRSFSILPQARRLVTTGPYSTIRHPLYLAECAAFLGASLQFRLPWSMMVFLLSVALQLLRIEYEEEILLATFPAYAAYRRKTWRLIPLLY